MLCSVREIEHVVKLTKLKPSEDERSASAPDKKDGFFRVPKMI